MKGKEKMRVALYGYGVFGKKVIKQLQCSEIEIVGIIDNYLEDAEGYKLWNAESFISEQIEVDYIIFAMKAEYSMIKDLVIQIMDAGYKVMFVPMHYFWYEIEMKSGMGFLEKDCVLLEEKPLERILFVMQDGCNFNCKGCNQFSPLFEKDEHVDFDTYSRDMHQLKKIAPNIMHLWLIGGEVLLRPDLDLYIESAREAFPEAQISIATNGSLLTMLSKKVVDAIRDNGAFVHFGSYPPTVRRKNELEQFAKKNKIIVQFDRADGIVKDKFQKFLFSEKVGDGGKCACVSPTIYRGEYSICSSVMVIDRFNRRFGLNYPTEGSFDLYDPQLTLDIFRKRIYDSIPLCDFCTFREKYRFDEKCSMTWEIGGGAEPQMKDWVVEV